MDNDSLYRLTILAIIVLVAPIGAYHRIKAAASGGTVSRKAEGYLFAILLRLSGLLLWIAVLLYLINPELVAWATIPLPTVVRWLGAVLGVSCSALFYWTLSNLGNNLTDTVTTRTNATLVTNGPYRWVRHPFYDTAALLMVSVFLLSGNGLIAIGSILVLSLLYLRTPKEEQGLLERFGDPYRHYMAATGRFIPKVIGFRKRRFEGGE